ncbi:cyanate transport [Klebsiella pneumoniae]|uniref:Cyanate transport n=1 Tax=Klebsiella pneumoniae TaxID=573 RepID=A0A377ZN31_KLEPN|nr:cyanate transport [Klebsiella pneumoniae]
MNLNLVCYSLLLLTAVGSALLPYPLAMWFLLSSLLTWLIYGADKLAARKPGAGCRKPRCWCWAWREAGGGHPRPAVLSP